MMTVSSALDWINERNWLITSAEERLELLHQIQHNLSVYMDAVVAADCTARNIDLQDPSQAHLFGSIIQSVITPIANNLTACIELYEYFAKNRFPKPVRQSQKDNDCWDIQVFPHHTRDKALFMDRRDYLRIRGEPIQQNPMELEGGVTAVLGAGCFSSAFEVIRSLFLDNSACVYKPHELNKESASIWEDILEPLVDLHALSFCDTDQGEVLVTHDRITKIYFTGGESAAESVASQAKVPCVFETGSNNPCIIVPGDVPWTLDEIRHQALHIATYAKMNGGAECTRPQTLITCQAWPQRDTFLRAVERALKEETPAVPCYYPTSKAQFDLFKKEYPKGNVLTPEKDAVSDSEFLLITDLPEDSFSHQHEAFAPVLCEVPLDTADDPKVFLGKAVVFCNKQLKGNLSCSVIMDEVTQSHHASAVEAAIDELSYGLISVNSLPTYGWFNPYLSWGAFSESQEPNNFGNMMCYSNVVKSISYSGFRSPSHLLMENKKQWLKMSKEITNYAIHPSWLRVGSVSMNMLTGRMRSRDF